MTGARNRSALGWCSWTIAVAAVVLAICNADSARNWADGLTPGPVSLQLQRVCDGWAEVAEAARLSAARDAVRGAWEQRHAVGWSDLQARFAALEAQAVRAPGRR
jgi:hypothetical protein